MPLEDGGRRGPTAGRDDFAERIGATPSVMADFDRFLERLITVNDVMNLVGPATLADFWNRHAWDSAQLMGLVPQARTWADLGAGAGFPGVVLAILTKARGEGHVWLIDSLGKRCRFLREVCDLLDLPATIVEGRAEAQRLTVDVVTARAVAPLDKLLGYAQPYIKLGAQGLFLKGEKAEAELQAARTKWHLDARLSVSESDPRGRIVDVRRLARAR